MCPDEWGKDKDELQDFHDEPDVDFGDIANYFYLAPVNCWRTS